MSSYYLVLSGTKFGISATGSPTGTVSSAKIYDGGTYDGDAKLYTPPDTALAEVSLSATQYVLRAGTPGADGSLQMVVTGTTLPTGPDALYKLLNGKAGLGVTGLSVTVGATKMFDIGASGLVMNAGDYKLEISGDLRFSFDATSFAKAILGGDISGLSQVVTGVRLVDTASGAEMFSVTGLSTKTTIGTLLDDLDTYLAAVIGQGDVVDASEAPEGVTIDLAQGGSLPFLEVDLGTGVNVGRLVGSGYDDVLGGSVGNTVVEGGAGDDVIMGDPADAPLFKAKVFTTIGGQVYGFERMQLSEDGNRVTFISGDSRFLAAGKDTNQSYDAFSYSFATDKVERISQNGTTQLADGISWGGVSMSSNGAYEVFFGLSGESFALYRRDLSTGTTVQIDKNTPSLNDSSPIQVANDGTVYFVGNDTKVYKATVSGTTVTTSEVTLGQSAANIDGIALSADKSHLAISGIFQNGHEIIVKDLAGGTSETISSDGEVVALSNDGTAMVVQDYDGGAGFIHYHKVDADWVASDKYYSSFGNVGSMSADGQYFVFASAEQLVAEDTNQSADVYQFDADTGQVTLVSRQENGEAAGNSYDAAISADGKIITFLSWADLGQGASGLVGPHLVQWNRDNPTIGGADTLVGGTGADTMTGGAGKDVFVYKSVFDFYDMVNDTANADTITDFESGKDKIAFMVPYFTFDGSLANDDRTGAHLYFDTGELHYVDALGNDRLVATVLGDEVSASDVFSGIYGTGATKVLTGTDQGERIQGGAGAQTMIGGKGDDTYLVDNAGDIVKELAGEGTDTVETAIDNYTLADNVENLVMVAAAALALPVSATGNKLDNMIVGNVGNNVLNGKEGADILIGGAGSDVLDGGAGDDRMVGGEDDDAYIVDSVRDRVIENTDEGVDEIRTGLTTLRLSDYANVENLRFTGTTASVLVGNDLDNAIWGNKGADTIDGGLGADTMTGSAGDDVYVVDDLGDVVVDVKAGGKDTIRTTLSQFTLEDYDAADASSNELENLAFAGSGAFHGIGNSLANILTGGDADDTLEGGDGVDTLNGGGGNDSLDGGAGADNLVGGAGDDVYVFDNAGDKASEVGGRTGGVDTILLDFTTATFDMSKLKDIENLTYLGGGGFSAKGNDGDNVITGGSGLNTLDGGKGNDTLVAGTSADVLKGGDGTDVADLASVLGLAFDKAKVQRVSQTDLKYAVDSTHAIALSGLESFLFTGDDTRTFADMVLNVSSDFDDYFDDAGVTSWAGSKGNDTYTLHNDSDVVNELTGQGTDTVLVDFAYTLTNDVENLVYSGAGGDNLIGNGLANLIQGGTGADSINGGAGVDKLYGNGGNDTLDGGIGADTLTGGSGDDLYKVDDAKDTIVEAVGEGTDAVVISSNTLLTFTLAKNVENLTYTGTGAFKGTGNELANTITGSTGADVLSGGKGADLLVGGNGNDQLKGEDDNDTLVGGLGDDTLTGGNGNDVFRITKNEGVDLIADFVAGKDKIALDATAFNIADLSVPEFMVYNGKTAHDADDRFIYDAGTKTMYYDADGQGGAGQVAILKFSTAIKVFDWHDFDLFNVAR
ncbi:MAG: beta strand repeat-containing protein [Solirubrobacterales bacterium]